MTAPLNVAILGAGPAAQAIHLPVLAGQSDRWRIAVVADPAEDLAQAVAARCGAEAQTDAMAAIRDPRVEVVCICSPDRFHAEQIQAACAAGKRAVLCEKPLAVTRPEAEAIADAARTAATLLVVGAMQGHDPVVDWALDAWRHAGAPATSVRSAIYLPDNARFSKRATDRIVSAAPGGSAPPLSMTDLFRQTILGLASHHIPLVRRLHPRIGRVIEARLIAPFGYAIMTEDDGRLMEMTALMPGDWPPSWTFEVDAAPYDMALRLAFPPSFVSAGGAAADLRRNGVSRSMTSDENGYQAQWRRLHEALEGGRPMPPVAAVLDDFLYALDLIDGCLPMIEAAR